MYIVTADNFPTAAVCSNDKFVGDTLKSWTVFGKMTHFSMFFFLWFS
jgi:hypothetical protein